MAAKIAASVLGRTPPTSAQRSGRPFILEAGLAGFAPSQGTASLGHKRRDVPPRSRHRLEVIEILIRITGSLIALLTVNPCGSPTSHPGWAPDDWVLNLAIAADGATAPPSVLQASDKPGDETTMATSTFGDFLRLGVRHILTGADHLIFLLGLLLVCLRLRAVVVIITSFTLAHTVTLVCSTLNVVSVSSRLVEPLIAITIMAVGLENLLRRDSLKRRAAFAFVFGLIHGFAFAGVLRNLLAGQAGTGLFLPLFSFNLGVEMGQIALAFVVMPILWWLRRSPHFERFGIPGLSALIALIGFYWLIERAVVS